MSSDWHITPEVLHGNLVFGVYEFSAGGFAV